MKKDMKIILGIVVVALVAFFAITRFYKAAEQEQQVQKQAGQAPVDQALLVKDWSPSQGPVMARVVLVEFLDPECESCRVMHPIVKSILKDYEGRIRYVLRYMPFHGNSVLAASWLEAAREQGKYWEALDVIFENQPEWGSHHAPKPELISEYLKKIGINIEQAEKARQSKALEEQINKDKEDGRKAGVVGTPTYFVNGRMLMELSEAGLRNMIEAELSAK